MYKYLLIIIIIYFYSNSNSKNKVKKYKNPFPYKSKKTIQIYKNNNISVKEKYLLDNDNNKKLYFNRNHIFYYENKELNSQNNSVSNMNLLASYIHENC